MMRSSRNIAIPVVVAVVVAVAGTALAAGVALGARARTVVGGTSINRIVAVRSTDIRNTSSKTFADVPGATATITVPAGAHAVLLARFTTQEDCNVGDGNPSGSCMARIMIGGSEMQPASGGQIIDTVANGAGAGVRSAALDRTSARLGPGTYTVHVQIRVTSGLMILEVTDWHLTVERVAS
jgi:hypothetical protein